MSLTLLEDCDHNGISTFVSFISNASVMQHGVPESLKVLRYPEFEVMTCSKTFALWCYKVDICTH